MLKTYESNFLAELKVFKTRRYTQIHIGINVATIPLFLGKIF